MALGVVTLRTIEYIVDASTKTFFDGCFSAPKKCGKNTFLNTVCGGVSTDFLF